MTHHGPVRLLHAARRAAHAACMRGPGSFGRTRGAWGPHSRPVPSDGDRTPLFPMSHSPTLSTTRGPTAPEYATLPSGYQTAQPSHAAAGSPFIVHIEEGDCYASKCYAWGPGLQMSMPGETAIFYIRAGMRLSGVRMHPCDARSGRGREAQPHGYPRQSRPRREPRPARPHDDSGTR